MNTRQTIRNELNELLLKTAEIYNDLIPDDISDAALDRVASIIEEARTAAEENLVLLMQELIKETTALVEEAHAKREARLKRLVPADVTPVVQQETTPIKPPEARPVLEGPPEVTLPREITSAPQETVNMAQLAEAAENISSTPAAPKGVNVEMDYSDDESFHHSLEVPLAQQKKKELGISPAKAPPKVFGVYSPEELAKRAGTQPPAPTNSGDRQALMTIRAIVQPYINGEDKSLAMLARTIDAVLTPVLGPAENFTKPPKEETRG